MKIENSTINPATGSVVKETAKPGRGSAKSQEGSKAGKAGDEVSLTSRAAQFHAMDKAASEAPVADANRVEEIKQAIREGRFKINPEVIADKLLATAQELASTKQE